MVRSTNRRKNQKGPQGISQIPLNGGGGGGGGGSGSGCRGKDKKKKSIPTKRAKLGGKKASPFARHGNQPALKKGKQRCLQANERGGAIKKGGRQQEFRFHLPSLNTSPYSYQKAPWKASTAAKPPTNGADPATSGTSSCGSITLQAPQGHSASSAGDANRRSICSRLCSGPMPTEGIPPPLLDLLDQELEQFGDFVRLTPVEVQARNRVAGAVQRAATQQYSGAQVQPFGSFATQAVCCFLSDIDLAVVGVVEFPSDPPNAVESNSKGSRKRKRGDSEHSGPKQQSPVDLKRERVKQWALALDSVDSANESSQGAIGGEVATTAVGQKGSLREVECDEQTPLVAFVDQQSLFSNSSLDPLSNSIVSEYSAPDRFECQRDIDASKRTSETSSSSLLDEGSDQDSADKLSSLKVRAVSSSSFGLNPSQEILTSLSSDTETDDDDGELCDTAGMEVSMSVSPSFRQQAGLSINKETRELCIDALKRIKRKLQKQVRLNRRDGPGCQLIKARVPIVKLELPAFEVDVAIAGCNGADTAAYAGDQVARFRSFAPVVLFLKVLLHQNKLDVPFEGGLGSYKLYVLVAYHIEKHLEQGGTDRPGEVLLSFLFRYGKVTRSYSGESVSGVFRTYLTVTSMVECGGGSADLGNVYLIQNCLTLFDMAWRRLQSKLISSRGNPPSSFLDSLVDPARLRRDRDQRMHFANLTLNTTNYVK